MNLDLLNKKEGYVVKKKNNPHFDSKHHKFRRVLPPPESKESESDPNYSLKKYSKQLVNKTINPDEFREALRSHGINPNIEAISKVIRKHEGGQQIKFNDLLFAVIKHRDTKFDPTKVNFEIKNRKYYTQTDETEHGTKSMVPASNGSGQLTYFSKKKPVYVKYGSYVSNKELFDWDASTLNKIKNGELNNKSPPKDCPVHKNVFISQVFADSLPLQVPKKQGTSFFSGTGDFFTWKGEAQVSDDKKVVRRNPNETSKEEVKESKPVKVNKMMLSSQENVLVNIKKR